MRETRTKDFKYLSLSKRKKGFLTRKLHEILEKLGLKDIRLDPTGRPGEFSLNVKFKKFTIILAKFNAAEMARIGRTFDL